MYLVLAFAVALLIAVYISGLAERSPVSTSVFFLIAGFLVGPGVLNLIQVSPDDPGVSLFIEITLVTVLFTDGTEISAHDVQSTWKLSGRALLIGLPLTLLIMAALAKLMTGVSWSEALLIGAVLSPTDPVFASLLVSQPVIPWKVRQLLNVESGMNDGLALPIILTILAVMYSEKFQLLSWIGELVLGVVFGIAVAWIAIKLLHLFKIEVSYTYQPLLAFSIGILVYSLTSLLHGNYFLAAFSAGVTVASIGEECGQEYQRLGKPISELLKLASLLIFGSLLSVSFFSGLQWEHVLFAFLVLLIARPIGLNLSLLCSSLSWKERLTVGWFGPRGFASVVYSLLVFRRVGTESIILLRLIVLVILLSILLHSSTDAFAPKVFQEEARKEEDSDENVGRNPTRPG